MEDYPAGYPSLARFLDSDDAFMVYRRFGYVYSRLLLAKQEEISRMEDLLKRMDKMDHKTESTRLYIKSCFEDARRESWPSKWPESRVQLMAKLEQKAKEYGISVTMIFNSC